MQKASVSAGAGVAKGGSLEQEIQQDQILNIFLTNMVSPSRILTKLLRTSLASSLLATGTRGNYRNPNPNPNHTLTLTLTLTYPSLDRGTRGNYRNPDPDSHPNPCHRHSW